MKDLCEAHKEDRCVFGCDLATQSGYKAEEMFENNCFDCYENKKECDILKKYRENSNKSNNNYKKD